MRALANVLALACLLALTLLAGCWWSLATEPGGRWLARQARAWVPGFSLARVEGVVLGRFAVQGLDYRGATERLHLDRLEYRLAVDDLWRGRLHFHRIDLHGPRYASSDSSPIAWPSLRLPFALAIDALSLRDGTVQPASASAPIPLSALDAALELTRDGLDIRQLDVTLPDLGLALDGHVTLGGLAGIALRTRWYWHPAGRPVFRGEGQLGGHPGRVLVHQRLQAPTAAELSLVAQDPLDRLAWTAQLTVPALRPRSIDPAWPDGPLALDLRGEGTDRAATIDGHLEGRIAELGEVQADARLLHGAPGAWRLERLAVGLPATSARFTMNGMAEGLPDRPRLDLAARWENLAWPLRGPPEWRSPEGRLSVQGEPADLRIELAARLADQAVTAGGRLGLYPERVEFRDVRAQGAGLALTLAGTWGPQLDVGWSLRADAPGLWFPGMKGQLSSRGRLQGPRDRPVGTAELLARDLRLRADGVRELSVRLSGGLTPDAPPLRAELMVQDLQVGDNRAGRLRLACQGAVVWRNGRLEPGAATIDLNLSGTGLRYREAALREIEGQARGGLLPGAPPLAGRVTVRGLAVGEAAVEVLGLDLRGGMVHRHGEWQLHGEPLELELLAQRLRQGERQARELRLTLQAGETPDAPLRLSLAVPDLQLAGVGVRIAIDAQGSRARHVLSGRIDTRLQAGGRPGQLVFRAEGGWDAAAWSGRLQQFDGSLRDFGEWYLQAPAALRLSGTAAELGPACWALPPAEICLQGKAADGQWQAATRLAALPLERFESWLPARLRLLGRLDGEARFAGRGERVDEGRLALTADGARLEPRDPRPAWRWQPQPLHLRGDLTPRGGELRLIAEDPALAGFDAELRLDGPLLWGHWRQLAGAGEARLSLGHLGALAPLLPDLDRLQGRVEAGVRFAGSVGAPRLQVHGALLEAGFGVPRLGIQVRSLNIDASSRDDDRLALTGRAVSGNGELRLDGSLSLKPGEGWPLRLNLSGKRFLAADIPEAKVYLSPDLVVERDAAGLRLGGRLDIPEADIRIPDESGAVRPSRDVVIVDAEAPPQARDNPLATRVEVRLGDRIQVTGPGYRSRVDGAVTIEQSPGADPIGSGEIRLHQGLYSLYGVDLDIDGGRLVFARSPMDNPSLDIEAVRKSDDVRVGAKLLGTLSKPSITLFADRPMSQSDILAYLMMGKPFDPLGQQSGSAMMAAANALGGTAGSLLARELSSRLGLGGFVDISMQGSLGAGGIAQGYGGSGPWGGTQSTALFLGKYLTPKIYVQYGMGLFQNAYVFRLRYDLTQRWKVQTETGEFSGGDILYQWED